MEMSLIRLLLFVFIWIMEIHHQVDAYSTVKSTNRRDWLQQQVSLLVASTTSWSSLPLVSNAKADTTQSAQNPLEAIREAQDTLDKLLSNWKRATIDCTFADVPRELLETKNKELLLEKASTFALFDKSVAVETFKTTNRIVRDYLGVTGKGPLVGIEKKLKQGLDYISPDDLEDYVVGEFDVMLYWVDLIICR